jgi:hypothetical protein
VWIAGGEFLEVPSLIGVDRLLTHLCKQNIKENIEGHAVDWYSDVFDLIFPDIDPNKANNLWKEQLKEPEKKEGRMESEELEENNAGYWESLDRMDRRKHAASLQIRAGVGFLGAFTMALKASEEACTVGGFMVLLDARGGQYLKDSPLVY